MTTLTDYDDGRAEALLGKLARVDDHGRRERLLSELVDLHAPLARHLARRYARRNEPIEDVEQAAMLGLVKAINRYDPTVGQHFTAYAIPTISGEVKRHFRDRTWAMRMPRRLQELRLSLSAVREDFIQDHGRAPTVGEISKVLDISEEEVIEALGATDAYHPISLDTPVSEEAGGETLGDLIGDDDSDFEAIIDRNAIRPLLEKLPERERTILLHRFYGNKTQTEIAEIMHLSQMHISRLISRTLAQLKNQLLQDG